MVCIPMNKNIIMALVHSKPHLLPKFQSPFYLKPTLVHTMIPNELSCSGCSILTNTKIEKVVDIAVILEVVHIFLWK